MNEQNDDKLMQAASQLATEIAPAARPMAGYRRGDQTEPQRRWSPMLAQAASVVMLDGGSAGMTWYVMQDETWRRPRSSIPRWCLTACLVW